MLSLGAGCAKKPAHAPQVANEAASGTSGVAAREGSQLAYEIELELTLAPELIAPRLEMLRQACQAQSAEQSCTLLSIEQPPAIRRI